ncbi:MAG: DNA alkylation repair enzyme [Actinobacteria bacterium ADurb.Bin444]|nr:MAG: DNA alkylation repair enzyme [Actinobacteria bacterium ADurb.Bin444]
MTLDEVIAELREQADKKAVAGMHRVGINPRGTLGVQIPKLQKLARRIGVDHALALDLWATGVHEARILAAMVDDPAQLTEEQMDRWAQAFDSWDVCDQVSKYLFGRSPLAYEKAKEWAGHGGQFVKRASFALMADLAVNDKSAPDEPFLEFLQLAEREAGDDRNYVKKSVNWAVRQIGKRNKALNQAALASAKRIKAQGSPSARWIAADALRELSSAEAAGRNTAKQSAAAPAGSEAAPAGPKAASAQVLGATKRGKKQAVSSVADSKAAEETAAEKVDGSAVPADPPLGLASEEPAASQPGAAEGDERPTQRRRRGSRGGRGRSGKAVPEEPAVEPSAETPSKPATPPEETAS